MASGRWSGGSRPRTEGRIFQLGRSSRALRGVGWCGKGGLGQAAVLRLGGRRRAPTPLRCSVSWPRRGTHCAPCSRSVQTAAPSQTTMRAARAAPRPVLLGASEARLHLPEPAFAEPPRVFVRQATTGDRRGRRCPQGARSGVTSGAAPGSARASALRELACRGCLNGAPAGRAVSSAARPWREHRSAVGLPGRPPQPEPPADGACRNARATAQTHDRTTGPGHTGEWTRHRSRPLRTPTDGRRSAVELQAPSTSGAAPPTARP